MSTIEKVDVIVTSPGRNFVTLKVTTSDGIVGWGDATLNGRELAVASYLRDHVADLLIGRDPTRIEDTWQLLYRGAYWRRGPVTMCAIGAVDLALWDIQGKALGVPVHRLLGGAVRDRVLAYTHASAWVLGELKEKLDAKREAGFKALRAQFGVPGLDLVYGVSKVADNYEPATRGSRLSQESWDTASYLRHAPGALAEIRDHVGPELHLLHDSHHRLNPTEAARLARALEPVDLFWLEDVTPAENQTLLRAVRAASTTPLAIGEVFNTWWDYQTLITERLIDYVRAAVSHAGGISHLRKLYAFAEMFQIKAGPHGPSDVSPITLSASVHLGLATPNFAIQEFMGYPAEAEDVFRWDFTFDVGYLQPGEKPGLGVEFDEEAATRYPYEKGYLPIARSLDGTLTDW